MSQNLKMLFKVAKIDSEVGIILIIIIIFDRNRLN